MNIRYVPGCRRREYLAVQHKDLSVSPSKLYLSLLNARNGDVLWTVEIFSNLSSGTNRPTSMRGLAINSALEVISCRGFFYAEADGSELREAVKSGTLDFWNSAGPTTWSVNAWDFNDLYLDNNDQIFGSLLNTSYTSAPTGIRTYDAVSLEPDGQAELFLYNADPILLRMPTKCSPTGLGGNEWTPDSLVFFDVWSAGAKGIVPYSDSDISQGVYTVGHIEKWHDDGSHHTTEYAQRMFSAVRTGPSVTQMGVAITIDRSAISGGVVVNKVRNDSYPTDSIETINGGVSGDILYLVRDPDGTNATLVASNASGGNIVRTDIATPSSHPFGGNLKLSDFVRLRHTGIRWEYEETNSQMFRSYGNSASVNWSAFINRSAAPASHYRDCGLHVRRQSDGSIVLPFDATSGNDAVRRLNSDGTLTQNVEMGGSFYSTMTTVGQRIAVTKSDYVYFQAQGTGGTRLCKASDALSPIWDVLLASSANTDYPLDTDLETGDAFVGHKAATINGSSAKISRRAFADGSAKWGQTLAGDITAVAYRRAD